ncbi:hypothetical protein TNCV_2366741 [Trichonephila clavipes]|nr:hypothetical protein TNCV_2366741 [Trichonephila clavipes]
MKFEDLEDSSGVIEKAGIADRTDLYHIVFGSLEATHFRIHMNSLSLNLHAELSIEQKNTGCSRGLGKGPHSSSKLLSHKLQRWKDMCIKINARSTNSKLRKLLKMIKKEQDEFELCNSVREATGHAYPDDKSVAKGIDAHYQSLWSAHNRTGLVPVLKDDRCLQTTLSRLASCQIKCISFSEKKRDLLLRKVSRSSGFSQTQNLLHISHK